MTTTLFIYVLSAGMLHPPVVERFANKESCAVAQKAAISVINQLDAPVKSQTQVIAYCAYYRTPKQ